MKKTLLTAIFSLFVVVTFSQTNANKNVYLKLSGGQVSFGSGDFLGYSFSIDASKNLIKQPSFGLHKLLIGGELIFENGVKNPIIQNPTQEEFLVKAFNMFLPPFYGQSFPITRLKKLLAVLISRLDQQPAIHIALLKKKPAVLLMH